jgi:hypothetical protein
MISKSQAINFYERDLFGSKHQPVFESRFQRSGWCDSNPWGVAPGRYEIAPLALNAYWRPKPKGRRQKLVAARYDYHRAVRKEGTTA